MPFQTKDSGSDFYDGIRKKLPANPAGKTALDKILTGVISEQMSSTFDATEHTWVRGPLARNICMRARGPRTQAYVRFHIFLVRFMYPLSDLLYKIALI